LGTTQFGGDIYRFEALGGVVITTPSQKAVGERGIYEVDQQLMVLTGGDLRIEADADFVTARDSIEWYEDRQIAIARGDAAAVRGDRRVDADVLVAHVEEDPQRPGTQRLRRVEAFGAVRVTTPTQVARGDRGVYVTATDTATLAGAVKLTQGDNQLNGDYGEMNMTTGVGRLLPSPDGRVRVHGLIVPSQSQTPPARPR
jgi:lipopolysaccharide export system protein LptA